MSFPGGSMVKNLPAMQDMQFPSLGQEDSLEKEMAIHSGIFAWKTPWIKKNLDRWQRLKTLQTK